MCRADRCICHIHGWKLFPSHGGIHSHVTEPRPQTNGGIFLSPITSSNAAAGACSVRSATMVCRCTALSTLSRFPPTCGLHRPASSPHRQPHLSHEFCARFDARTPLCPKSPFRPLLAELAGRTHSSRSQFGNSIPAARSGSIVLGSIMNRISLCHSISLVSIVGEGQGKSTRIITMRRVRQLANLLMATARLPAVLNLPNMHCACRQADVSPPSRRGF